MSETETNAVTHPDERPSQDHLDTGLPAFVAQAGPARRAIRTIAIIFALFLIVGASTQALNTAVGIWFTEVFVFLGVAWVRVRLSGGDPVGESGLATPHWKTAAFGFALGVANFFALVIPIQVAAQSIAPPSWREQFDMTNLFKNQTSVELSLIVSGVVLAAPFCEEFVFRGVLQRALMPPAMSSRGAVVLAAAIFSAFHLDPVGFAARFELGLIFGFLFLRTGSIWPGILAHAANNLISTVLYFRFRGVQPADEMLPSWSAIVSVTAFGMSLLVGLFALVRRDPSLLHRRIAAEAPRAAQRPPWGAVVRPWIAGALATFSVLAIVERRGLILSWYDLEYRLPPLGKNAPKEQKAERAKLDLLRKEARAGKVPLEMYRARRAELSRESRAANRDSG